MTDSQRDVLSPRAKTNLLLLWVGQFISSVGDQFFSIAGNMLVLTLALEHGTAGASAKTGLMGALRAAPALLFGIFGGVIADRFDRRRLMIGTDIARAILLMGTWHAWRAGLLVWWMLPVAAFLCHTFSTVFEPARNALIPQLAEGAPLLKVNSIFQSSMQAAFMLGGLAVGLWGVGGGALTGQTGAELLALLIALDGVTFLVSAAFLVAIRLPAHAAISSTSRPTAWTDVREILGLAWRDRRLRSLLFLTALNNLFIMGPASVGAALLFQREREAGVGEYAWFGLAMSIGFLIGTAWVLRYGKKWTHGTLLLVGMIADGVTYLPFVLFDKTTPVWRLIAVILVHGFFIPWITVARTSIVQRYYPSEIHGRIFACIGLTVTGFMSLSAALTGVAGEWLSSPQLFFCAGAGGGLVGLIGLVAFDSVRKTV